MNALLFSPEFYVLVIWIADSICNLLKYLDAQDKTWKKSNYSTYYSNILQIGDLLGQLTEYGRPGGGNISQWFSSYQFSQLFNKKKYEKVAFENI